MSRPSTPLSPVQENVARQALLAKAAAPSLAALSSRQKTEVLGAMADAITAASTEIVFHNEIDVEAAREVGLSPALIERLVLTPGSVEAMAKGVREISAQSDPVGEVLESWTRPGGL